MFSTGVLKELVSKSGRYIEWEPSVPLGDLKQDRIVLKEADGREVVCTDERGRSGHVNLPRDMLDDFLRGQFVRQDGRIFRPTTDGTARGLVIDYAAQALVWVWPDPDREGRMAAQVLFDGISFDEAVRRVVAMPADQRSRVASIGTDERLYDELSLIEAIARRDDFPRA